MSFEQAILERLDRIEAQLQPMTESARAIKELKEDVTPLLNGTMQLLIEEFSEVEPHFRLDDLLFLVKKSLRSIKNFIYALEQMENVIDLFQTAEPLLKSSVPNLIHYLDDLEQQGVFRIIQAGIGVRSKIASAYTAEDIDQIGDGLVAMLGLAKKLSDPRIKSFLEKMAGLPASLDLTACKGVGPFGLIAACGDKEIKDGLGVLMELTKAMGKLKS